MRQGLWLRVALAVALLGLLTAGRAQAQSIGNARSVTNQVDGVIRGAARPLAVGGDVFSNELIRTGDAATAQLVFLDNTNLNVGPRSAVTLDRFVYNPDRNTGRFVVRASRGIFRFVTGSQPKRDYTIRTPIATIGVRGTVFDLLVDPDKIVVVLVEGAIVVTTAQGRSVSLTVPGTAVTIYAGGRISGPAPWTGTIFDTAANAPFPYFGGVPTMLGGGPDLLPGRFPGRFHLGLNLGGAFITHIPTSSTSGFYDGFSDNSVAPLIGGSVFYDFTTVGSGSQPFGSFVLSGGLVVDDVINAGLHWHGACGGVPCDGSGHMNELNYIAELKATTPLAPGYSLNGYVGAGGATMWPSGSPTGGTAFTGSATAPALRIGWGVDHQLDANWSAGFKVGFQHTFSTTYDTTLPGEFFRFDHKDEALFALTLMYTP